MKESRSVQPVKASYGGLPKPKTLNELILALERQRKQPNSGKQKQHEVQHTTVKYENLEELLGVLEWCWE